MDEVTIRLHIEPLDEQGYVATSPDVPGLVAEGRSIVEAVEIVESYLEHGDPVPAALSKLVTQSEIVDLLVPVSVR